MAEASPESKPPSKLEIDRPDDFKFHLAYNVYSKAWDNNSSEQARLRLNELISDLANNADGYESFYSQIQEYRRDVDTFAPRRTRIRGERKRAWQASEARSGRNRRHR